MKKIVTTIAIFGACVLSGLKVSADCMPDISSIFQASTDLTSSGKNKEILAKVAADAAAFKFTGEMTPLLYNSIEQTRRNLQYSNLTDVQIVNKFLQAISKINNQQ